ncbi:hypothetical protein C2S52_021643 [Perilla frutescens var. hirtella]|nr:hypothetical protein C2S52_021643 [Perilla frutescens var. hirtella]KAH6807929.1 hypothetical protein C2S51_029037 [Perilla frutescens var. frutescens]
MFDPSTCTFREKVGFMNRLSHIIQSQFDEIIPTGELLGRRDMLPIIYCHPSSKRPHPQGSSSSDKGKAPLEATVSSTDERELLLENASLLWLSDQPTISASSQPPPLVQSDYIEVDFEAVLDHQL